MTDTEKILEFDRIKEKLAELACTEKARLQIQELKPSLSELEVKAFQRETTEARKMIEICGNPPVTALQGVDEWIEFASKGVFCKHFLEKNAKYFWRMLHLQIGESCKASAGSYSASYIAIADHI